MKIRQMKLEDFDELYALWKRVGLAISDIETEKNEAEMMIQLNKSSCLVAVEEGKIIGTVFGTFNGRWAWIYHLAVHPKWQHKGIGKTLLAQAEKALYAKRATKILLAVALTNLKVAPFYEKQGYSVMNDMLVLQKDFWRYHE